MDFMETPGYCIHCKQNVTTRHPLPPPSSSHRVLSLLSFGFWPLYWFRVGWRCKQCGKNADNEKIHIPGRRMGGLRAIDFVVSRGDCPRCNKEVLVRRNFLPPTSLHQRLSFVTAGNWPFTWLQTGWRCGECGEEIDGVPNLPFEPILTSEGHCEACGDVVPLRRRAPRLSFHHWILSAMSAGSWPFHWIRFGWVCDHLGHGGDEVDHLMPGGHLETRTYCKKCGHESTLRRTLPRLNFFTRIMSVLTGGYWSIRQVRSGWRCTECNAKVDPDLMQAGKSVQKVTVEAN
ncbi:MAG: hypothetical protein ACOCW9_08310 [Thermodesulfobacteriota bacterium]